MCPNILIAIKTGTTLMRHVAGTVFCSFSSPESLTEI